MPRERNRGNEPRRSDDLFASDGLVDILANPSEYGSVR
jgi:hypothetical protein